MKEHQFELVDVEYVKEGANRFLRAYIDKEGGITINDLELINRTLSDLLDTEDFIPDSYILEVSSPGLGRTLKKEKDFLRSIGEEVDVGLYKNISIPGPKGKEMKVKEISGILKEYDETYIIIETEFEENYKIEKSEISIVKLSIHF